MDKICGCLWGSWMIFTGTDSFEGRCPGLFKTCWVPGIGNGTQLQDHAKAPQGLTGVADADRVRKSVVFLC